jgi:hypothetical protein
MKDNRVNPRVRSFLRGEIVHSAGSIRIECLIRDLSDGGARLQVARSVIIPDPFELQIQQKGLIHRCRIIWRHEDELGAQFRDGQETTAREGESAASIQSHAAMQLRIERLETEMEALRGQIMAIRAKVQNLYQDRA